MNPAGRDAPGGWRVLLAEDEWTLMDDVATALGEAGVEVVGPVSTLAAGLALAAAEGRIDGALLDVNLRGEMIWPLVDVLLRRGVPVVLVTGYDEAMIPAAYAGLPLREKPVMEHELVEALLDAARASRGEDEGRAAPRPAGPRGATRPSGKG